MDFGRKRQFWTQKEGPEVFCFSLSLSLRFCGCLRPFEKCPCRKVLYVKKKRRVRTLKKTAVFRPWSLRSYAMRHFQFHLDVFPNTPFSFSFSFSVDRILENCCCSKRLSSNGVDGMDQTRMIKMTSWNWNGQEDSKKGQLVKKKKRRMFVINT